MEKTPGQVAGSARLHAYWAKSPLIAWGTPGAYERCVTILGKYLPENQIHGFCANTCHEATGHWPGEHNK